MRTKKIIVISNAHDCIHKVGYRDRCKLAPMVNDCVPVCQVSSFPSFCKLKSCENDKREIIISRPEQCIYRTYDGICRNKKGLDYSYVRICKSCIKFQSTCPLENAKSEKQHD